MTINSAHRYLQNLWDWAILDGCFGQSRIRPMDIDGYIERYGRKLFIETKAPGVKLSPAQFMALHSLVDDGHAVLILWGHRDQPERIRLMTPRCDFTEDGNLDRVREIVNAWFQWADRPAHRSGSRPMRPASKVSASDIPM